MDDIFNHLKNLNMRLQNVLGQYLSPRARADRMFFNSVYFLASIPLVIIKFMGIGDVLGAGAGNGQVEMLMDIYKQGGMSNPEGMQAMQQQANEMLNNMSGTAQPGGIDWGTVVFDLGLIALIPLCMMRLRDMGWDARWAYVLLVPLVADTIKQLTGFDLLPFGLGMLLGVAGFVLFTIMCMKGSAPRKSSLPDFEAMEREMEHQEQQKQAQERQPTDTLD